MRKIASILIFTIFIQSISGAYIKRDITIIKEKTIPFSFVSESSNLEEEIKVDGLKNVVIKSSYIDNGKLKVNLNENRIELDIWDGDLVNDSKTIVKTECMEINDVQANSQGEVILDMDNKIKTIETVSGDFSKATITNDGNIKLNIKDNIEGKKKYDESNLVKSRFTVRVDTNNRNRKIESEGIILPHDVVGSIEAVSGDTSYVQDINVNKNVVKVLFNNKNPVPNEKAINLGYSYCWVDRGEDGKFKLYKPNSIYSTDQNKITGIGEYLDKDDFDEIGMSVTDANWEDYCGAEIDGVRYIYSYDKEKGIPNLFISDVLDKKSISFSGQHFNSERYTVNLSDAGVTYVPEGKLYSMGELVEDTYGWGEVYPNHSWESKKVFFNEISGKYETYVRHFKFFYGPREKKTFGGYYTYPYECVFEYEHYKPIECYSGEIVYTYEVTEKIEGYPYNGWVKIQYEEDKSVNDYPPNVPYDIKYNQLTGEISWKPGSDDYTPEDKLKYDIEVNNNGWNMLFSTEEGINSYMYKPEDKAQNIRIRTVDELNQVSDWSYAIDSSIDLTGQILPYIVKPGDSVNIKAFTKSFDKIDKVTAENDELKMYCELEKVNEETPKFFEMSYGIFANFPDYSQNYLTVDDARYAIGNKDNFKNIKFKVFENFENETVNVDLLEDIKFNKKGTLIFSNFNYLDVPFSFFKYGINYWYLISQNEINIVNKVTGEKETLFRIKSIPKNTGKSGYVPSVRIEVNKFEYDTKNRATYEKIEIDKDLANNPVVIRWETDDNNITKFYISLRNTLVYTYTASWNKINQHVDNFYSVEMYRLIERYNRLISGIYAVPNKITSAAWPNIVSKLTSKRLFKDFLWIGYKIKLNDYNDKENVDEYNNNPQVRNNYRLFLAEDFLSDESVTRYINNLKLTNIPITIDNSTVWASDVTQYASDFEGNNIKIPSNAKAGNYDVILTAVDEKGNRASIILSLLVQIEENNEIDELEKKEDFVIEDTKVGRFFYRGGKGFLEELKVTNNDTSGFICAGETLGVIISAQNIDFIQIDFNGDKSIKEFDSITKKFLYEIPNSQGKYIDDISLQYNNFPKIIYPHTVDNKGNNVFKYFYTIPYKTKQSLESWSSLKSGTLEEIDKNKLFNRKMDCYEINIYPNGIKENKITVYFDVFERWDTVLNRDVSKFVKNSSTKWEMRVDK